MKLYKTESSRFKSLSTSSISFKPKEQLLQLRRQLKGEKLKNLQLLQKIELTQTTNRKLKATASEVYPYQANINTSPKLLHNWKERLKQQISILKEQKLRTFICPQLVEHNANRIFFTQIAELKKNMSSQQNCKQNPYVLDQFEYKVEKLVQQQRLYQQLLKSHQLLKLEQWTKRKQILIESRLKQNKVEASTVKKISKDEQKLKKYNLDLAMQQVKVQEMKSWMSKFNQLKSKRKQIQQKIQSFKMFIEAKEQASRQSLKLWLKQYNNYFKDNPLDYVEEGSYLILTQPNLLQIKQKVRKSSNKQILNQIRLQLKLKFMRHGSGLSSIIQQHFKNYSQWLYYKDLSDLLQKEPLSLTPQKAQQLSFYLTSQFDELFSDSRITSAIIKSQLKYFVGKYPEIKQGELFDLICSILSRSKSWLSKQQIFTKKQATHKEIGSALGKVSGFTPQAVTYVLMVLRNHSGDLQRMQPRYMLSYFLTENKENHLLWLKAACS